MPSSFLSVDIWPRLTKLARRERANVAVAYCSTGARRLLPLRARSVLVVDASSRALEAGLTNPEELEKFVRADVEVHNASRLHAKVFVFGRDAIIGSANASRRSANYLQEAALHTTEHKVIRDARNFVLDHTGEWLTIPHPRKLRKIYRPPRFVPDGPLLPKSKRSKPLQQFSNRHINILGEANRTPCAKGERASDAVRDPILVEAGSDSPCDIEGAHRDRLCHNLVSSSTVSLGSDSGSSTCSSNSGLYREKK